MTLAEFKALKQGDRIANHMTSSRGIVESIDERGVTVQWTGSGLRHVRYYSVVTTAWMHWSIEDGSST